MEHHVLKLFKSSCKSQQSLSEYIIQGVPELADQIETVYSLIVMKVKNV
jgi:hypothetical protein